MKANLILPCGGLGARSGLSNKLLAPIDIIGTPVIVSTLAKFLAVDEIVKIILPCSELCINDMQKAIAKYYPAEIKDQRIIFCIGGGTRTDSVKNALKLVDRSCPVTMIHDGARPHVSLQIIQESLATALECGASITAVPAIDTIGIINDSGQIVSVPERQSLAHLQTPQTFLTNSIMRAYEQIKEGEVFTDDSSVYMSKIGAPSISKGEYSNIKLTNKDDFNLTGNIRVGVGYDMHKLVEGRALILGGVNIPHTKGLLGHSDADALIHAVMDALLTACNQRDIGNLFPDTDEQYRGISSIVLLQEVYKLITDQGYSVGNVSAVIMAEKPKLAKFIPQMIQNIASVLNVPTTAIGISATTTEGIGFIGREEGIASHVACTVIKNI